jgi:hypothetical protein
VKQSNLSKTAISVCGLDKLDFVNPRGLHGASGVIPTFATESAN